MSAWSTANQAYLGAELDRVLGSVDRYLGRAGKPAAGALTWEQLEPPALDRLVTAFGLTGFERDTLLLCAGVELDERFATVVRDRWGGAG